MNNKSTSGGGVSGLTLLSILFIGLKLGGVIDWSWWWVLAPTWMPLAIALLLIVVVFLLGVVARALGYKSKKDDYRRYLL